MKLSSLETTSVWKFPKRGDWATHKGDYRGNWPPQVPRNLILKYSVELDTILDQFLGSGTTLIECRLLNRNAIGIDINMASISLSKERLRFPVDNKSTQDVYHGNATCLKPIQNNSIDLICTHPPYSNIIQYSTKIDNDLSRLELKKFLAALDSVAKESFRVLKKNKFCAIMMGDIRSRGNIFPLGFQTMNIFLNNGFILKEIIIKEQYNCKSTTKWQNSSFLSRSYLIAHEYILIFQKT